MNDQEEPRHRIGAVVRLTGVSAHALRAWERRYGALEPERTDGGDRLYSDSDVRRLRLIKRLTDYGHAIGSIAGLGEERLEQLLSQHTEVSAPANHGADDAVERYLDAIGALDLETAERVLRRASSLREPRQFIEQVADPMLLAVGQRWQDGSFCVANEHAASAMLRTHLGALLADLPVEPGASSVVSTTPSGERHEFGALFAAIVAARSGWRGVYLGPDLPASEIATAVRATGSVAALISIVALPTRKARAELAAIRAALPSRVAVVVGGAGAQAAARGNELVERLPDLATLGSFLAVSR